MRTLAGQFNLTVSPRTYQPCCKFRNRFRSVGHLKININKSIDLDELRKRNQGVKKGGFWTPHDCPPRSRVIIIVPHRNRWSHLIQWLAHYHPILQRQKLEYRIVVTEQVQRNLFNKGRLYNAAFLECERAFDFDCVIFHDVDMLLENDHNMYWCYNMTRPRHLSPAVDKFRYQLPYHILVGGVLAMTRHMFKRVNGFSNQFWGWGGEDDDMWGRLVAVNTTVDRPHPTIGRYTMIKHRTRKGERNFMLTYRLVLLATSGSRWSRDGLNDVRDYCKLTQVAHEPLFTHFVFDVGNQPRQKPRNT
ncbi:beta-1,4-galactosyltransferase 1 [Lingula anatina]|uniref:Beta-1,4-galactosyltransferase n=1 Tax=Lingula anatina TaxID=7574 RepID=A0A1S3K1K0_LINAN|nr:beta-1,4-galactosyltransferase 1 [Lingula anatina]|eukprot:XP_013416407.1 beta-1,4-galactosyltransferase 1 [Lingula anatina]